MKNILRICFCLLLFACVSTSNNNFTFKSQLSKLDLVSSNSGHNHSTDENFFAEDNDDDGEMNFSYLQCAHSFNDLKYGVSWSNDICNFEHKPISYNYSLIILHRVLRL